MPLIRPAILEDLALMIEHDALDFWLNLESRRDTRQTVNDRFQRLLADCRWLGLARVFGLEDGRRFFESGFLVCSAFFDRVHFIARHFQAQGELGLERSSVVFA